MPGIGSIAHTSVFPNMETLVDRLFEVAELAPDEEPNFPSVMIYSLAADPALSDSGLSQFSKKGVLAPRDRVRVLGYSVVGHNTRIRFEVVSITMEYRRYHLMYAASVGDACYIDILNPERDKFPSEKFYKMFVRVT